MKVVRLCLLLVLGTTLVGCETTNSIPYKASTTNIIAIQEATKATGLKVNVGTFELAPGVDDNPTCRLMGPVKVSPGKTPSQYIKDAFIEELFAAQAYDPKSTNSVSAEITTLGFSSVSPASWKLGIHLKSNSLSGGYTILEEYKFETSFTAMGACKNVADAFGPAVQELLHRIVTSSEFPALAGAH